MPGIEEFDLRARIVSLEGFGSCREKERIGLAPDGERRRSVEAEVILELGIQLDVTRIVEKQIELNVLIAGTRQQGRVECIGLWGHARLVGPVRVLPLRGLRLQKGLQRRPVFGTGVFPVLLDRVSARAEPFLVGIAVLRHNRGDPFRMPDRQPETNGGAVIEDIKGIVAEAERSVNRSITSAKRSKVYVKRDVLGASEKPNPGRSGAITRK